MFSGHAWVADGSIDLRNAAQSTRVKWEIIRHGEERVGEPRRGEICAALARILDVDLSSVLQSRALALYLARKIHER
ncbi:MAG: hypothetical protein DMD89_38365 [Candidatus Rokuibacteriota bacterium]|nr:MAG: hypothetical protein DMD89_38365 [Candidatus Rokubacteria bacterium]